MVTTAVVAVGTRPEGVIGLTGVLSPPESRTYTQAGLTRKAASARTMSSKAHICRPASSILQCDKLHAQPALQNTVTLPSLLFTLCSQSLSCSLQVATTSPDLQPALSLPAHSFDCCRAACRPRRHSQRHGLHCGAHAVLVKHLAVTAEQYLSTSAASRWFTTLGLTMVGS